MLIRILNVPLAAFTSVGLILAAWTLIRKWSGDVNWGVGRVKILKVEGGPCFTNESASMSRGIGDDILAVLNSKSVAY